MSNLPVDLYQKYAEASDKIGEHAAGTLPIKDLMPFIAPFGVYPQKDGRYMARIRVPGGELSLKNWTSLLDLAETAGSDLLHVTTRQDLQIHNLPGDQVGSLMAGCARAGMPFHGGGGNTYRNTIACVHSGLSEETVFDVLPVVREVNDYILGYGPAFSLPRKFKAGFFCCAHETVSAMTQDLGFVAVRREGENGFRVFGGGGMGRESMCGLELASFVPVPKVLAYMVAMIDLFHDHGDRNDRNQARLRFVLKRLGNTAFRALFQQYLDSALTRVPDLSIPEQAITRTILELAQCPESVRAIRQEKLDVRPIDGGIQGMVSLRIQAPGGCLTLPQAKLVAALANETANNSIRFGCDQSVWIPVVSSTAPGGDRKTHCTYNSSDISEARIRSLFTACIGAGVCRIGLMETGSVVSETVKALEPVFHSVSPEKVADFLNKSKDAIRISGCLNTCSGHLKSSMGLQGAAFKIADQPVRGFRIFLGSHSDSGKNSGDFSVHQDGWNVEVSQVPKLIRELVSTCIRSESGLKSGLCTWIREEGARHLEPILNSMK